MSLQNLRVVPSEFQANALTNASIYYKVNYRYSSMLQLDKSFYESEFNI